MVDMEKLRFCIQKYIYADTTIDVNDADEIRKRAERIFNSSTYKKQVERSKKNWLDLSVDEVLKENLELLNKISFLSMAIIFLAVKMPLFPFA